MEYRYRHEGKDYTIQLEPRAGGTYLATIGNQSYIVEIQRSDIGQITFRIDDTRAHAYVAACDTCKSGSQLRFVTLAGSGAQTFELERVRDGGAKRATSGGGDSLMAQMPGQVRQVLAAEGDSVESGQALMILEAMKMEIRITAPHAGTVARLYVQQGQTVERGQQLADVTPAED